MLFLFVVFFTLADVEAADNSIKPDQTNVLSMEGSNISLSCTYTGSVNSLHWYRQKPGSRPEFLLLIIEASETVIEAQPPHPRLSIKLDKTSDSMADSIKPLFTHKVVDEDSFAEKIGPKEEDANIVMKEKDTATLRCSYESSSDYVILYWYKQYPNSAPQFLLYKGAKSRSDDYNPSGSRFNAETSPDSTVLTIKDLQISDTALYHCALRVVAQ
ncbi:hypothetical protein QTP70_003980 [Hemibagrus guttatus]|uniref:Ig-like domain-containing protein n=1 Tax=Hemibagrus guttatus TaxID=175788 RepID=A0AAE0PQ00_9TELE|nr:hypothetical protein QTP70_003980 [Hemibagrus guttatus]